MEKKLKFIFEMENEVKLYVKHVESFCNTTKGKSFNLNCEVDMTDQHRLLGETLRILYKGSVFQEYIDYVSRALDTSTDLYDKVTNLIDSVKQMCQILFKLIAQLKVQEKDREMTRVAFDHYRTKLQKLEKSQKGSDSRKQETYQRNVEKYTKAKEEFDVENGKLEQILD